MRNLKRVLSLALAALMLMGMMVVGAGAASSDFTDADEIKNVEAVDVMVALGILEGGDKGDFQPNSILTREQAAKIICYMLMGPENAEKLATSGAVFSDVAANRWSAPYIAYCVNLGILAGDGNGNFFPEGKLTGAAFAKMLLVALGYDAKTENYVGNSWTVNVATDALAAGILPKGSVLTAELSRQDAAQMAFMTLEATMVEYKTAGSSVVLPDGTQIITSGSSASKVENNNPNYDSANTSEQYLQFCEKYFADLTKVAGDPDDFGRNADYKWQLDGKDVHNVVEEAAVTFTAATSEDDVLKAIKGYSFKNAGDSYTKVIDKTTAVTGDPTAVGALDLGDGAAIVPAVKALTANGKLVEIFADSDKKVTDVVVVTYATYEVTKVSTNKDGDVTYRINNNNYVNYADEDKDDSVVLAGAVEQGDIVTMVVAGTKAYVYPTTSFEGTQTASKTKDGVQTITVDGTNYVVGAAKKSGTTFVNSKDSATYYVDQYGYVVHTDSKAVASTDYAYIVSTNASLGKTIDGVTPTVEVRAVLSDGTVGVYELALEEDGGSWTIAGIDAALTTNSTEGALQSSVTTALGTHSKVFGYTLKDGVMTLEDVASVKENATANDEDTVYSAQITMADDTTSYTVNTDKTILVNNDTKFVVYKSGDKAVVMYSGVSKLPSEISGTGYVIGTSGLDSKKDICTASYVFLYDATTSAGDVDTYVYIDYTDYTEVLDKDNNNVKQYTGINADGSTVTLTTPYGETAPDASGLYKYNEDMEVVQGDKITLTGKFLDSTGTDLVVVGDMVKVGGNFYYITDATEIVYIDSDLSEVDGNKGIVVLEKEDSNKVASIFVTAE